MNVLLNIMYHIIFQVSREMEDSYSYVNMAETESKALVKVIKLITTICVALVTTF